MSWCACDRSCDRRRGSSDPRAILQGSSDCKDSEWETSPRRKFSKLRTSAQVFKTMQVFSRFQLRRPAGPQAPRNAHSLQNISPPQSPRHRSSESEMSGVSSRSSCALLWCRGEWMRGPLATGLNTVQARSQGVHTQKTSPWNLSTGIIVRRLWRNTKKNTGSTTLRCGRQRGANSRDGPRRLRGRFVQHRQALIYKCGHFAWGSNRQREDRASSLFAALETSSPRCSGPRATTARLRKQFRNTVGALVF